jgi:hypothetical protein
LLEEAVVERNEVAVAVRVVIGHLLAHQAAVRLPNLH